VAKKPGDIFETLAKHAVQSIELRYTEAGGAARCASIPAERLDAATLSEGFALDPGAILLPDVASAHLDPFRAAPTLVLLCDLLDAEDEDPRRLAKRAEEALAASGAADAVQIGSELRYYVFDAVAYENAPDATGYRLEPSAAGELDALRSEVLVALHAAGIEVALQRAIPGASGQTALELRPRPLVRAADAVLGAKHAIRAVAESRGKSATFMPKPLANAPGSGFRVSLGLLKDGKSPFFDKDGWSTASQTMLFFIGGVLAHVDSLLGLCAPSANSYTRLAEERLLVAFGPSRAATAVAVDPPGLAETRFPRIAFRPPDLSANPYLAFAALLCAGLDGIAGRIDPISAGFGPLDARPPRGPGANGLRALAPALRDALDALDRDQAYLTGGGVFSAALLSNLSAKRRATEVVALERLPHPYEYELSFDC